MGAVFGPEDITRRRMMQERALSDLNPAIRDSAKRILETYRGEELELQLQHLLGKEKAESVLKALR
ncbi:MAG: hypothetical protein V1857_07005 [archaeon]